MIEQAIFSDKQGGGYISDNYLEVADMCDQNCRLKLGETLLVSGNNYDLEGFFRRELLFVGCIKDTKEMVFYIGGDNGKHYWQSVFHITERKFYLQYQPSGGRDYDFVKGQWSYKRKGKNDN